ncbi:MAG: hypothetical protein ABIE74_06980 [Pseudomonadota bacterium]
MSEFNYIKTAKSVVQAYLLLESSQCGLDVPDGKLPKRGLNIRPLLQTKSSVYRRFQQLLKGTPKLRKDFKLYISSPASLVSAKDLDGKRKFLSSKELLAHMKYLKRRYGKKWLKRKRVNVEKLVSYTKAAILIIKAIRNRTQKPAGFHTARNLSELHLMYGSTRAIIVPSSNLGKKPLNLVPLFDRSTEEFLSSFNPQLRKYWQRNIIGAARYLGKEFNLDGNSLLLCGSELEAYKSELMKNNYKLDDAKRICSNLVTNLKAALGIIRILRLKKNQTPIRKKAVVKVKKENMSERGIKLTTVKKTPEPKKNERMKVVKTVGAIGAPVLFGGSLIAYGTVAGGTIGVIGLATGIGLIVAALGIGGYALYRVMTKKNK